MENDQTVCQSLKFILRTMFAVKPLITASTFLCCCRAILCLFALCWFSNTESLITWRDRAGNINTHCPTLGVFMGVEGGGEGGGGVEHSAEIWLLCFFGGSAAVLLCETVSCVGFLWFWSGSWYREPSGGPKSSMRTFRWAWPPVLFVPSSLGIVCLCVCVCVEYRQTRCRRCVFVYESVDIPVISQMRQETKSGSFWTHVYSRFSNFLSTWSSAEGRQASQSLDSLPCDFRLFQLSKDLSWEYFISVVLSCCCGQYEWSTGRGYSESSCYCSSPLPTHHTIRLATKPKRWYVGLLVYFHCHHPVVARLFPGIAFPRAQMWKVWKVWKVWAGSS